MRSLSDLIEQYLRRLIGEARDGCVEIRRSELADKFRCVPSQINYVLATRFNLERGFLVESRRGGGGYIRIVKVDVGSPAKLLGAMIDSIGDAVSQHEAEGHIMRLFEEEIINKREVALMRAALNRRHLLVDLPLRDKVRAKVLKGMLLALLSCYS